MYDEKCRMVSLSRITFKNQKVRKEIQEKFTQVKGKVNLKMFFCTIIVKMVINHRGRVNVLSPLITLTTCEHRIRNHSPLISKGMERGEGHKHINIIQTE